MFFKELKQNKEKRDRDYRWMARPEIFSIRLSTESSEPVSGLELLCFM